jgi:hypothetical protein
MTTLLPYETDSGPLLLAAEASGTGSYGLSWARPGGDWRPFATLIVSPTPGTDETISFDPLLHQISGLRQYPAIRRLREPAYAAARGSRGATASDQVTGQQRKVATEPVR